MYEIETNLAPKDVWFTPAEAKNYYGHYDRSGITIHWWGDASGADNHDNIVNFFLRRKDGSVNYVVSDNKITKMVEPDDAAWCQQTGNATDISIEHQPTLGAEGYKKSGWLVHQLELRYGRTLVLHPHKFWYATACPGTIDLSRIRAEADKWATGDHGTVPVVTPAPVPTPVASPSTKATVTVDTLNVRSAPTTSAPGGQANTPDGQLHKGDVADIVATVQGEAVSGNANWLKTVRGNFIWAGGTNVATHSTPPQVATGGTGGTAQAIRETNVRTAPNTSAALGGSQTLQAGDSFTFTAIVHGQPVSQNGASTDLWYHSTKGNFVWAGNCKNI